MGSEESHLLGTEDLLLKPVSLAHWNAVSGNALPAGYLPTRRSIGTIGRGLEEAALQHGVEAVTATVAKERTAFLSSRKDGGGVTSVKISRFLGSRRNASGA